MTANQIHQHFKTVKKALSVLPDKPSRVSFYRWKNNRVPALRQRQYEEITNGELKADRSIEAA